MSTKREGQECAKMTHVIYGYHIKKWVEIVKITPINVILGTFHTSTYCLIKSKLYKAAMATT